MQLLKEQSMTVTKVAGDWGMGFLELWPGHVCEVRVLAALHSDNTKQKQQLWELSSKQDGKALWSRKENAWLGKRGQILVTLETLTGICPSGLSLPWGFIQLPAVVDSSRLSVQRWSSDVFGLGGFWLRSPCFLPYWKQTMLPQDQVPCNEVLKRLLG